MSDTTSNWEQISLPLALSKYRDCNHVAHCMLWFRSANTTTSEFLNSSHPTVAYAFFQLRFDGKLGFPGGVVDEDVIDIESIGDALRREMLEEINFSDDINADHYVNTYFHNRSQMVSHFFAKELTSVEAERLEQTHTKAEDFPRESLGLFRVPIGSSIDSYSPHLRRFMSNFIRHKFAANCQKQMIYACEKFKIMSQKDLEWTKSQL